MSEVARKVDDRQVRLAGAFVAQRLQRSVARPVVDGDDLELIAVAGDPLSDITELERVKFVMAAGEVAVNAAA